jgi:nucleolin
MERRRPREEEGPTVARKAVPSKTIFIGNIPFETSDVDLNRLFRELDNVTDVRVSVDRNTGWPRGYAHADFVDIESAEKALKKILQTTLNGRTLRADFAVSRRGVRDSPRKRLAAEMAAIEPESDTF